MKIKFEKKGIPVKNKNSSPSGILHPDQTGSC